MAQTADEKAALREDVWAELRKVGRPDSRHHWDFSSFIPDFDGSEKCSERMANIPAYASLGDRRVFVTPDNCLDHIRTRLLLDGHPYVMTTLSMTRGFLGVEPDSVTEGEFGYAGSIDGANNRFGRPVTVDDLRAGPPFGLMVTGCSVVSQSGVRFGKGHGYFDVEWAVMSELGKTDENTAIVVVCHDVQVREADLQPAPHDTIADWIVTPTRTISVDHPPREPGRIRWELLARAGRDGVPVLEELRELVGPGVSATPTDS